MERTGYIGPEAAIERDSRRRFEQWRGRVEGFKVVNGFASLLAHVPDSRWIGRFAANEEPLEAVIEEAKEIE